MAFTISVTAYHLSSIVQVPSDASPSDTCGWDQRANGTNPHPIANVQAVKTHIFK